MLKKNVYDPKIERIVKYAKAISNPARVSILLFLASRDTCYFGNINDELPICKATVSQHLTELKNAGLIVGEIIGSNTKYCINCKNWVEMRELLGEFFQDCGGTKTQCSKAIRECNNKCEKEE